MPRSSVPADVRFALYDCIFAYAWALDRADADGIAATFTSDGTIKNVNGDFEGTEGIKQFARQAFQQAGFAGRQHHVQPLFIEPAGDGWKMTSYWMAVTWDAGRPAPEILMMGWYEDIYVQENGEWLCKSKAIPRWDSSSAPMVGRSAPRPEPQV